MKIWKPNVLERPRFFISLKCFPAVDPLTSTSRDGRPYIPRISAQRLALVNLLMPICRVGMFPIPLERCQSCNLGTHVSLHKCLFFTVDLSRSIGNTKGQIFTIIQTQCHQFYIEIIPVNLSIDLKVLCERLTVEPIISAISELPRAPRLIQAPLQTTLSSLLE